MTLTVYNPYGASNPDGSILPNSLAGKQGEVLNANLHGKWYNANVRRNLFSYIVRNVVLGVANSGAATNGLSSVFVLSNPAQSGINAEIVSTTVTHSSATTVAGDLGWFILPVTSVQSAVAVTPATFTKAVVGATANAGFFSGRVGDVPNGAVVPYSAMTFTTTGGGLLSFQVDCVGTIGATSDTSMGTLDKQHDGRLILPPGQTILFGGNGLCASANLQVVWAEWPFA